MRFKRSGRSPRPLVRFAAVGLAGFGSAAPALASSNTLPVAVGSHAVGLSDWCLRYDFVLGTSLDAVIAASSQQEAEACESSMLAEIDRLTAILSTYAPDSQISRFMRGEDSASPELHSLLGLYDEWNRRTGGAIDINLGRVRNVWKSAQNGCDLPAELLLRQSYSSLRSFNVDALGKAFIVDRIVETARRHSPQGLINIGGDIRVWGERDWPIGIFDPACPADNADPLTVLSLRNASIAGSGGAFRHYDIAGERFSHLIDPRTLWPLRDVDRSAVVVARDCVSSNAVATAACILDAGEAHRLASEHAQGYLAYRDGRIHRGGIMPQPPAAQRLVEWGRESRVEINITLKQPEGTRIKRPYVAVWIEDVGGKPIRNITLWGKQEKYLPHLSTWFKLIHSDSKAALAMAAPTRVAGKYVLNWDGRDDRGKLQTPGKYKVRIEISREHGTHAEVNATIDCTGAGASATLDASSETEESTVVFTRKKK